MSQYHQQRQSQQKPQLPTSQPQQPPLTYIDANILIAYVMGPDADPRQYPLVERFMKEIAGKKRIGALSYLTTLEIMEVLRGIKARDFWTLRRLATDADRTNYVVDGAKQIYQQIISEVLKTPEIRFMDSIKMDVTDLYFNANQILSDMKGSVRFYHSCKKCKTEDINEIKFVSAHKCVGAADVVHVLLAKEMKCNIFATLDRGFYELTNEPRIKPVSILVLK